MGPESADSQGGQFEPEPEREQPGRQAFAGGPSFKSEERAPDELNWVFFGGRGLRAGWSLLVFVFVLYFALNLFDILFSFVVFDVAHLELQGGTPLNTILAEGQRAVALLAAVLTMAGLEHRRLVEFNLATAKGLGITFPGSILGRADQVIE